MITLIIPQLSAANRKNNSSSSVHSQTTRTKRCINVYAVVRSRHNFCRLLQPLFSAWLGDSTGAGYGSRVCTVCGRNRSSTHTAAGAQPPKENPNPVLYRFTLWHICRIHAHFQLTELGGVARALTVRPSTLTVQWLSASPSGHFHQTSQTFIASTSTATPNFLVENLVKQYQQ